MPPTAINNLEDVIDSRDIIARLEELRDIPYHDMSDEERAESIALRDLDVQGRGATEEWEYGAALVRDTYFVEYAQDYAEDIGAVPAEYSWPTSYIDWDAAAHDLRMDYTPVEFDGVTYWVR